MKHRVGFSRVGLTILEVLLLTFVPRVIFQSDEEWTISFIWLRVTNGNLIWLSEDQAVMVGASGYPDEIRVVFGLLFVLLQILLVVFLVLLTIEFLVERRKALDFQDKLPFPKAALIMGLALGIYPIIGKYRSVWLIMNSFLGSGYLVIAILLAGVLVAWERGGGARKAKKIETRGAWVADFTWLCCLVYLLGAVLLLFVIPTSFDYSYSCGGFICSEDYHLQPNLGTAVFPLHLLVILPLLGGHLYNLARMNARTKVRIARAILAKMEEKLPDLDRLLKQNLLGNAEVGVRTFTRKLGRIPPEALDENNAASKARVEEAIGRGVEIIKTARDAIDGQIATSVALLLGHKYEDFEATVPGLRAEAEKYHFPDSIARIEEYLKSLPLREHIYVISSQYPRIQLEELANKCESTQDYIKRVLLDMIANGEIHAEYFADTQGVIFDTAKNMPEIAALDEAFKRWGEFKGKKT